MNTNDSRLKLKYLGINTYKEPVLYIREDSNICKSEGFEAQARVKVTLHGQSLIATLNTVQSELLRRDEASLSAHAWSFLKAIEGDVISLSHPKPLDSLSYIRSKLYGNTLKAHEINEIILDLTEGRLSDIHIAMFLSAAAGIGLNLKEVLDLTKAMVHTGRTLSWSSDLIVDKHCVGGLPGNRTTLIVVPIVASFGLIIPKTSSRAITSPAGTADTMEIFAPVNLDIKAMRKVVERENGCITWGGNISLSPADDLLIHVERTMNIDSTGQLVASILSKKIAAGANHLVIDMPIGPTAKIRSLQHANTIKQMLEATSQAFNLETTILMSDGTHPVGRGIGPALEAKDVLSVLMGDKNAPSDLKDRALTIAGHILEFSPKVPKGRGKALATTILNSGKAFKKFEAICDAQGGMFSIPTASYQYIVKSNQSGKITSINNRHISSLAKLAGAPNCKASGVELLTSIGMTVKKHEPLFVIHAEAKGELDYALSYLQSGHTIFKIEATL